MSENPILAAISKESGLTETQLKPGNPLISGIQQASGTYLKPSSDKRYGFDGLDIAAGGVRLTNTYTDPLESYTSYGVPRNAFVDFNEERAQRQSTGEKWAHGLTKAGITALGALTENTVGVASGLLNMAFGENHSYYDNPVGRAIDSANEWARETMPNYYTKQEEHMSVLEGMGTANFWADKVANGAGYTLGSIATMWTGVGEGAMIAKLGQIGRMSKIAKAADAAADISGAGSKQFRAYNAAKAVNSGTKGVASNIDEGLEQLAKRANIKTASKHLSVGLHMSMAEASVEARETKNRFIEEETARWEKDNPGQDMPVDVEDGIIQSASAAGNLTFGINLPILTITNMIAFGKAFKGGKPASEEITNKITKEGTKWVESLPTTGLGKAFAKSSRMFGAPLKNSVTEAIQEGGQFLGSSLALDYYSDKFADGVGDMAGSFTKALGQTFGTKEGIESMVIGAIVGGGSGVVSKLAGAEKKFLAEKNANTQKALSILNSEGFGKALENMENTEINRGIVVAMNKATENKDFMLAEKLRKRLISSIANGYRKVGALDSAVDQLDDLKQLDEKEFKARWGYDAATSLKEQTGMEQSELIEDVKNNMKRSIKRQEQVESIIRAQNPAKGLFANILNSFESEQVRNSKVLERSIRGMYANQLLYRLENVDAIDDNIKDSYDKLVQLAPAIAQIPENEFQYMVKTGQIEIDDKGEIKVNSKTTITRSEKATEKLTEIFNYKSILNPEDAVEFSSAVAQLGSLVKERQAAVQSYEGLRNKPEDLALLVEAELAKRKFDDAFKKKQQAEASIANSQSSDELNNSFPETASPEDIAAARLKAEELIAKEDEIVAQYEKLSDEEFYDIDPDTLGPLQEAAYNRQRRTRDEEKAVMRDSKDEVLSDIEARTFGEIMVNPDGHTISINGRTYSNLEDNPLDAVIRTEEGVSIGVTLTDMSTGNKVTFKSIDLADSTNPEITERKNAIAEGLIHLTYLQAASIRPDQTIPIDQAKEEIAPRIQAAKEDAEVRDKFEENTQETELEKELAINNMSKTAALSDAQIRVQLETLKADLQEINEIITLEEQIAKEAGFTKAEFDKDPTIQELRSLKKRTTSLINTKIKALRARKQNKINEVTPISPIEAEIENTLSQSEEDLLIAGLTEEIKKLEEALVSLEDSAKSYKDLIAGKYGEGQDIAGAGVQLKSINQKIGVVKSKITKKKNLINKQNEERELEKLRQDRDAAQGTIEDTQGEGPEAKDINSREALEGEGMDGILNLEQVEELNAQKLAAQEQAEIDLRNKQLINPPPIIISSAGTDPAVISVAGEMDTRLAKGEFELNSEFKVLVAEEYPQAGDTVTQTINGVPITVDHSLSSNPLVAAKGVQIRFEVREDTDWWKTQTPAAGEEWKTVPIYVVVTDVDGVEKRVALLQASTNTSGNMRRDIYNLYKAGLTPVAESAGKIYDNTNFSNMVSPDGQSIFNSANTAAQTGIPSIVYSGIADKARSWRLITPGDSQLNNLEASILSLDSSNTALGQIGIISIDPNGLPIVTVASTRSMTESGRVAALSTITGESPNLVAFSQIVGVSEYLMNNESDGSMGDASYTVVQDEVVEAAKTPNSFMLVEMLANQTELITFFSPSTGSLVRISAQELKSALLGATPRFSFVEIGLNDKGFQSVLTVKKDDSVRSTAQGNVAEEFKAAIMLKKFQVSKDLLSSNEAYTSPITQKTYNSYFEYLTAEDEVTENRNDGLGSNAILGVDTFYNSQGSPLNDVGIRMTNLSTIEKDVTTERELAARQIVAPSIQYSITETPTALQPTTPTVSQSNFNNKVGDVVPLIYNNTPQSKTTPHKITAIETENEVVVVTLKSTKTGKISKAFLQDGKLIRYATVTSDNELADQPIIGESSKDRVTKRGFYIMFNKPTAPVSSVGGEVNAEQVRNKLQEIEKQPVKINVTQDVNGKMEQTSQEVIDNIKAELNKTGLPYSDVVSNEKGSTYFVVTKDGQQHEILKVLQSGGKLVPTNLTKAKWINHLIKTEKDAVVKAVEQSLKESKAETTVNTKTVERIEADRKALKESIKLRQERSLSKVIPQTKKDIKTGEDRITSYAMLYFPPAFDGVTNWNIVERIESKSEQEVIDKINAKYDAELKAPEQAETTVEEIGKLEDSSIFDVLGLSTPKTTTSQEINPTTGLPGFLDKYIVDDNSVDPNNIESLAEIAALYKAEAQEIENKCKGE